MNIDQSDKIVFFEVQPWESAKISQEFPHAILVFDKLTEVNAHLYEGATIISTFIYSDCNASNLAKLKNLKKIASRSTGTDHIDSNYCQSHSIIISNVPEYGSNTVAEHTFALILSLSRKIYESAQQVKELDFSHENLTGIDLFGKTLGIIGLGKIGKNVARIGNGFGMKILAYNRSQDPELMALPNFEYADFDTVLSSADVITLHLPLTDQTRHIINYQNISKVKKGSIIVNTARGPLIQTEALLKGLSENLLSGVGLDVIEEEETLDEEISLLTTDTLKGVDLKNLLFDHILIHHKNVIITPHNAFNSQEALDRILQVTFANIHS